MTTSQSHGAKAAPTKIVTTNTGRILRVSAAEAEASIAAATPPVPSSQPVVDPARRTDVLLRKRRPEGHELSAWWMIGAFLATSGLVILLLSGVPGVA